MPYEDKKAVPQRRPHAVTLDERSHLTVTGVDEVVRFDDTEVSMRTSRGMLTVHGEGLRVGRLAIDTGELAIDGAFDALDYTEGDGVRRRLLVAPVRRMKLPLLGQLAQLMLGLGLGAALGLAFDMLRVPRRHARSAVFRALLDGAFCLLALASVFLLGMTAGDGQVRLFLFAAIAGGWTCYFLWLSGHIFPQLERSGRLCARKMRQITAPGRQFIKKFCFLQKTLPISPQMF